MACKALIDVANTNTASVVTNGTLPLGTITRRRMPLMDLGGDSIVISDTGSKYYLVTVNATFTAPAAGVVTLHLQQNGSVVPGAVASTTIATATTEARSLSFQKVIRTFNNVGIDTVSVLNAGVAATFSNVDVSVIQL